MPRCTVQKEKRKKNQKTRDKWRTTMLVCNTWRENAVLKGDGY